MSGRLIPFYSYYGSYLDRITTKLAECLEEVGRVKVVEGGRRGGVLAMLGRRQVLTE